MFCVFSIMGRTFILRFIVFYINVLKLIYPWKVDINIFCLFLYKKILKELMYQNIFDFFSEITCTYIVLFYNYETDDEIILIILVLKWIINDLQTIIGNESCMHGMKTVRWKCGDFSPHITSFHISVQTLVTRCHCNSSLFLLFINFLVCCCMIQQVFPPTYSF